MFAYVGRNQNLKDLKIKFPGFDFKRKRVGLRVRAVIHARPQVWTVVG